MKGRREWEQGSYTTAESGLVVARSFSFRGWQSFPGQITALVLNRRFLTDWFKFPLLREAETVGLGLVMWGLHKQLYLRPVVLFLTGRVWLSLKMIASERHTSYELIPES